MVFDKVDYLLKEGTSSPGQCVVAYRSIQDSNEYGGEQSLLKSKYDCENTVLQVFHPSLTPAKNVSGIWSPPRALRSGFMDSEPACKDTCPEQIWVSKSFMLAGVAAIY